VVTASVGAGEDDAFGHFGEAGGDAVAEGGAQLGGGEVGGDEGGEQVLVPVVDQPVGQLLGPLAGLGRAEVVQEQQRAPGQGLQVAFGVVAGAGAQAGVEVGGGGGFPAQADATAEERADGAVRLVRLAGAGGAGDQQRRALRDAGCAGRARASGACDLVDPGGDLGVVDEGVAVAGGDAGVGQLQGGDRLGRRFLGGCGGGVDAAGGQDCAEAGLRPATGLRWAGACGGRGAQSSPP